MPYLEEVAAFICCLDSQQIFTGVALANQEVEALRLMNIAAKEEVGVTEFFFWGVEAHNNLVGDEEDQVLTTLPKGASSSCRQR